MKQRSANVTVGFDSEQEEVVITVDLSDCEVSHRLRPLHGWLLLYLLDPEFTNNPFAIEFCESALANDPPVGLAETNDRVLLSLPAGHIVLPKGKANSLRTQLLNQLTTYSDSLVVESDLGDDTSDGTVSDGQHRHGNHP